MDGAMDSLEADLAAGSETAASVSLTSQLH